MLALVVAGSPPAVCADPPPQPRSEVRASVELTGKSGEQHAIVTAKKECGAPAKCPAWTLDLGRAETVDLLAVVDLLGEPTRVRGTPGVAPTANVPASAKLPAAFVRTGQTDAANTKWERWAVVSLDGGRPKLIWRGEIAMISATGGGFSTADGVELVATEPGRPLALAFAQTSVQPPSDKPRRASPPIRRRFVMTDGTYQPTRPPGDSRQRPASSSFK